MKQLAIVLYVVIVLLIIHAVHFFGKCDYSYIACLLIIINRAIHLNNKY